MPKQSVDYGAAARSRTPDILLTRQALYRLSYNGEGPTGYREGRGSGPGVQLFPRLGTLRATVTVSVHFRTHQALDCRGQMLPAQAAVGSPRGSGSVISVPEPAFAVAPCMVGSG